MLVLIECYKKVLSELFMFPEFPKGTSSCFIGRTRFQFLKNIQSEAIKKNSFIPSIVGALSISCHEFRISIHLLAIHVLTVLPLSFFFFFFWKIKVVLGYLQFVRLMEVQVVLMDFLYISIYLVHLSPIYIRTYIYPEEKEEEKERKNHLALLILIMMLSFFVKFSMAKTDKIKSPFP